MLCAGVNSAAILLQLHHGLISLNVYLEAHEGLIRLEVSAGCLTAMLPCQVGRSCCASTSCRKSTFAHTFSDVAVLLTNLFLYSQKTDTPCKVRVNSLVMAALTTKRYTRILQQYADLLAARIPPQLCVLQQKRWLV